MLNHLSTIEAVEALVKEQHQMRVHLFASIELALECIQPENRLDTERKVAELQRMVAQLKELTPLKDAL